MLNSPDLLRVLLDECLPKKLKHEFVGCSVSTVPEMGWAGKKTRVFEPYLGPQSRAAWRDLEILWEGKDSLMDIIRAEAEGPQ